jgi:hypothetical protein
MKIVQLVITALIILFVAGSCHRKTSPGSTNDTNGNKTNTTGITKPSPVKKKIRTPIPKVIVVNDKIASKTFDGRYYYDLEGHRYWRNNADGKYYLYNKSMATDPAFKKQ